jgi:hypothetical protein
MSQPSSESIGRSEARPPRSGQVGRAGNALKRHDNSRVQRFIASRFHSTAHLCHAVPGARDILFGVAHLKTAGHTATRPLRWDVLFCALAHCPEITTAAVSGVTQGRYSRTQVERYAGHARVASKALESLLDRSPWLESLEDRTAWEQEPSDLSDGA